MKRCENCGGTRFRTRADRHVQCDMLFDTSNGEEKYSNCDDIEQAEIIGDCVCVQCGKIYRYDYEIPDDGAIIGHWESPALKKLKEKRK